MDRAEIWAKEEWDSYNSGENFVDSSLSDKMVTPEYKNMRVCFNGISSRIGAA